MAEHPNAPRCHHVRTNGLRCGSPAMRNHKLCYYHKKTSGPQPMPKAVLPNLEDGNAVQLAIAHVARQIVSGTIEYRAAHLLIDAYRLALRNLKNMDHRVVSQGNQVTIDEDMEDLDNSHTTEPITSDEELDMMDEGTLPQREAIAQPATQSPQDATYLAQHVSAGNDELNSSPVGTAHRRIPHPEQGERSEAAANHRFNGKRETENPERSFEDLSEQEQEAFIMRASGNKAYFMKEEDIPKRSPESDNLSLEEILKEALVG